MPDSTFLESVIPPGQPPTAATPESLSLRDQVQEACQAWLTKSPSPATRENYQRDLQQFKAFAGIPEDKLELLVRIKPAHVSAWRDELDRLGLTASSIRRKLTVLRSLYSYLQTYGYAGSNPAHGDFVAVPPVPRDGKTVGLSPEDCRRLLDAPAESTPVGIRDRALLGILAYTGCRVGELSRLKVGDYKMTGGHKILDILGKGGKCRRVPLHPDAFERLETWLERADIRDDLTGALFRPAITPRGNGHDGFAERPITRRAVQFLVKRYVAELGLDPAVSVHSLRVTALTTAREQGCDIIDLQDFAGYGEFPITVVMVSQWICGLSGQPPSFSSLFQAVRPHNWSLPGPSVRSRRPATGSECGGRRRRCLWRTAESRVAWCGYPSGRRVAELFGSVRRFPARW